MKEYKIAIVGFGTTGRLAFRHLLKAHFSGTIKIAGITITDIRQEALNQEVIRSIAQAARADRFSSIQFDVAELVSTSVLLPRNMDIYWLALPSKRNVHDSPIDIKPLNKLIASLQHVIHDSSVIINSTLVPVGRNMKLYKKLTMGMLGDTRWVYVPINPNNAKVIDVVGVIKQTPKINTATEDTMGTLELKCYPMEEVEFAAIGEVTHGAVVTQHANELNTLAHARGLSRVLINQIMDRLGVKRSSSTCGDLSNAERIAASMFAHNCDIPFRYLGGRRKSTPLINGLLDSGEYREDYVFTQILHVLESISPNSANQAVVFLHGSSEQANAIIARLHRVDEIQEYIQLYQVPSVNGDPVPEVRTMTHADSTQFKNPTRIRLDLDVATHGGCDFNYNFY